MDEQLQQLSVFTNIIIVGGSGAVSTSIESILKSQKKMITRLGGSDRYETALIVADYLIKYYGFEPMVSFLLPEEKFPDALASGHLSCKLNAPVLLVDSLTSDLQPGCQLIKLISLAITKREAPF